VTLGYTQSSFVGIVPRDPWEGAWIGTYLMMLCCVLVGGMV
jgi:hypothetical protein